MIFFVYFQQSPTIPELVPSSSTGKQTIVAQNPFDDQPHLQGAHQSFPRVMQNKQMVMPPSSTAGHQGPLSSGKIYPSNQAMVFNASNPNAPPIYPCGICHKEVHDNDHAILCESGCNFWYHRVCTGLTEPAFLMLTQEIYAEWVCNKCVQTKNIPLIKMKP